MRRKVLAVGSGPLVKRGVESYLINVYRQIDHTRIAMDFLTPCDCKNEIFFEETKKYGDSVYELNIRGSKVKFLLELQTGFRDFLKKNEYDVVYINTGNAVPMAIISRVSKQANIGKVIVHSHNGGEQSIKNKIKMVLSRRSLVKFPDVYWACSKIAANFVFPKEKAKSTIIIPNGIDLKEFRYHSESREEIRKTYDIGDRIVIGHVGAFIDQKNHEFIIKLFERLRKGNPDKYKLVLIGEGERQNAIRKLVDDVAVSNDVIFVGRSECVNKWLSAFDVFILPSKFEGLPVCVVEAQAAGLPCLLSDRITKEVELDERTKFLSIDHGVLDWEKQIQSLHISDELRNHSDNRINRFDISSVAQIIQGELL